MTDNLSQVLQHYGFPGYVSPMRTVNQLHVTDKTPSGRLPASFSGVSHMRSGNYMGGRLGMVVAEGMSGLGRTQNADMAAINRGVANYHDLRHRGIRGMGATQYLDNVIGVSGFHGLGDMSKGNISSSANFAVQPNTQGSGLNYGSLATNAMSLVSQMFTTFRPSSKDAGTSANTAAVIAEQQRQAQVQMEMQRQQLANQEALLRAQQQASTAQPSDNKNLYIGGGIAVGVLALVLLLK
jgi:hypothetical protein